MQLYAVCKPWLTILGVWPLKKFGYSLAICATLSVLYLLIPEIIFLYKNYKNVELFGSCFCELMVVCQGLYKLLILMYHQRNWAIVIRDICQAFKTYEHFTEVEVKWINRLQFFIGIYIKMFIVTGAVYITSPNLFAFIQFARGDVNVTLLPETAKIDLVFVDLKETPIGYAIYTSLNILTVTYIALVCGTTDILYLSTIYFGVFYLRKISSRLSEQPMTEDSLREFAINHNSIITIFKRVQKLSKTFMLIMYFSSLSMTCFIGLVLTTVPQTTNSLINFTMFLGTVQAQMIAYSFLGEMLLNCSSDVIRTLWEMNWYEQPVTIQSHMIKFIMLQAQNSKIALSASSVLNIGYESYLKYIKTSFQILCLLQSFYI